MLDERNAGINNELYDPRHYAADGLILRQALNECNTKLIFMTPGMCEAARKGVALRGK